MADWFSGLLPSTDAAISELNSQVTCSLPSESDLPNWESLLKDPNRNVIPHMRAQRQVRNDCAGNANASGTEKRMFSCTGEIQQFSDTAAYLSMIHIDRGRIGTDSGSTITAGVTLVTRGITKLGVAPGIPLEKDWPYSDWTTDNRKFEQSIKATPITDAFVSEHAPVPDFRTMLVCLAAGGCLFQGTWWGGNMFKSLDGIRLMDRMPRSGGGHATCGITAVEIKNVWYLVCWNSHSTKPSEAYYLMSEACFNQLRRVNWEPFGAYVIMPDKAVQRTVDWYDSSPWYD